MSKVHGRQVYKDHLEVVELNSGVFMVYDRGYYASNKLLAEFSTEDAAIIFVNDKITSDIKKRWNDGVKRLGVYKREYDNH